MAWRLARYAKLVFLPSEAGRVWPVPASAAGREAVGTVAAGADRVLADALGVETAAFLRLAWSAESRAKIAAFFAARKR